MRSFGAARVSGASAKRAPKTHPIEDQARQKWKSSGLTDDHARALGLRPLTKEETWEIQKKEGAKEPLEVDALLLPYFDLDGKRTDFYRIRYLGKLPGWAGAVAKPQRYWQPPRTLNEVYLPPILKAKWKEIAKDVNIPIYITEGEFKSASACGAGLACIGLGGVDVWRSTKRGIELLPALQAMSWKNRSVIIVYDSDAASNPNVVRAQRQLAKELIALGALPAVASLPSTKDGHKQGLDDFLVAHGSDALLKLLADAPFFPEADALWGLNEEVVYVRDPGLVVELASGLRFQPSRFVADAYSDRHYVETQQTKQGAVIAKKRPLARRWMEWEGRFKTERMTYAPGKSKIFDGTYNTWPGWGCEPKRGDVAPWKWLLGFLFQSDPEWLPWFEKWCAYPIQHPGAKLYTSAMIWGRHKGTGKSFAFYALQGIYGRNSVEINNKDLRGNFNSWAKNRQFIHCNEISGAEARIDADWLKGLITQPEVHINEKYLPEYVTPDQMNYGMTSNHPDSLFIEDDDRRYFVHEVVGPPANRDMYEMCHKWLHGDGPAGSYQGAGASALFYYLLDMDLKGFNPREHAPSTTAKQRMMLSGKTDLAMWCVQLKEDPYAMLKPLGDRAARECHLFTPSQLLRAYDPDGGRKVTPAGMARELVRAGFRQVNGGSPVKVEIGLVRLYGVRNGEEWMTPSPRKIADHYNKFFKQDGGKY